MNINKSLLIYCFYLLNNWTWCLLRTYILASWKYIYIYVHLLANKHERIYCGLMLSWYFRRNLTLAIFFIIFNLINTLFRREKYSGVQIYICTYATLHWKAHKIFTMKVKLNDRTKIVLLFCCYIYIDIFFFGTVSSSER